MSDRFWWLVLGLTMVLAPGSRLSGVVAAEPEINPFDSKPILPAEGSDPFGGRPADKPAVEKEARPKVPLRYGEDAVNEALEQLTTMEFCEVPLSDVVAFLQQKHRIHVRLDRRALDEAAIGTDTPITLDLARVPLRAALEALLPDLDLTWTIDSGMLLITTREQAESMLLTRTYEVAELLFPVVAMNYDSQRLPTVRRADSDKFWGRTYGGNFSVGMGGGMGGGGVGSQVAMGGGTGMSQGTGFLAPPCDLTASADFDSLIEAITSTIAPATWDEVGGPGSIVAFESSLSLIISQTRQVHRQIEALLEGLRDRRRDVPTVVIDAHWLLLDAEGLDALMGEVPRGAGRLAVDSKRLDQLARSVPGVRGRTTCASGTSTYLVAGQRRSQITSAIPVVGSGIGYQPVISIPNVGVLLEVRPVVDSDSRTATLEVQSVVTRWGEQPSSVTVGAESPEAEVKELGHENESTRVPASGASTTVDRPNIAAQELAASLRVPLGQPMLVGGMTLVPDGDVGEMSPDGERKQLYLVVETSVVRPADRDDER
jgi:hypothetical protein